MKTGGRLVKHARYYWLLLSEGHLNRRLFGDMLRRIWALPVPGGYPRRAPSRRCRKLKRVGVGVVSPPCRYCKILPGLHRRTEVDGVCR